MGRGANGGDGLGRPSVDDRQIGVGDGFVDVADEGRARDPPDGENSAGRHLAGQVGGEFQSDGGHALVAVIALHHHVGRPPTLVPTSSLSGVGFWPSWDRQGRRRNRTIHVSFHMRFAHLSTQIVSEKRIKSNFISKNIRRIIIIHSRKFNSMCICNTTDLFSVDTPLENGHRFGRSRSAVEWHPFTWQVTRLDVNNDGSLKGQICCLFFFVFF